MTDLSLPLASIEKALQRLDRRVLLEMLQEGLPAEVVRSSLAPVGLTASPELEALYGWKNGTAADPVAVLGDIYLFPGIYLLSLEDAVVNYQAFVTDARWKVGWLPLFADGGGDFYVLDLSRPAGAPVRHFRIEESEHPIEYGSLQALAAGFDRGIFFVNPRGYLDMDDLVFGELAAELNPDVDWWHD
jgi:hypothetical protein